MSEEEANAVQEEIDNSIDQVLAPPVHAWDQQPGESSTQYADFLTYMALGRGRTIDGAYRAKYLSLQRVSAANDTYDPLPAKNVLSPVKASGPWWQMASRWRWEERASKHDVFALSQLVPQTVTDIFKVIGAFAKVTLEALENGSVKPQQWSEAKGAVETLASYVSPDIIQATVNHAGDAAGDGVSTASQAIIDG